MAERVKTFDEDLAKKFGPGIAEALERLAEQYRRGWVASLDCEMELVAADGLWVLAVSVEPWDGWDKWMSENG